MWTRTVWTRPVWVAALLLLAGCAAMLENSLNRAIGTVSSEQSRDRYADIAADPEVQAALKGLLDAAGEGATGGAVDGVLDADRQAALQRRSAELVAALSRSIGANLDQEIGPAAQRQVAGVLAVSMQRLIGAQARRDAKQMAADVSGAVVSAFATDAPAQFADVLAQDLGPALQQVLEENLGRGLANTMTRDLTPAMQDAVHTATRAALEGVGEAMLEGKFHEAVEKQRGNFDRTVNLLWGTGALILVLLGAVGWVIRRNAQLLEQCHRLQREGEAGSAHADEMMVRLAAAIRQEDGGAAQRIAQRVKLYNGTPGGQRFKKLLEANPALHIEVGGGDSTGGAGA